MDEEKIEEMREKRYIRSLDLLELGRELRLAEEAVKSSKEQGYEGRVKELEEYCEILRNKIEARMPRR